MLICENQYFLFKTFHSRVPLFSLSLIKSENNYSKIHFHAIENICDRLNEYFSSNFRTLKHFIKNIKTSVYKNKAVILYSCYILNNYNEFNNSLSLTNKLYTLF